MKTAANRTAMPRRNQSAERPVRAMLLSLQKESPIDGIAIVGATVVHDLPFHNPPLVGQQAVHRKTRGEAQTSVSCEGPVGSRSKALTGILG